MHPLHVHSLGLAVLLLTCTQALAQAAPEALPAEVGQCAETTITAIGGRLSGDTSFESGTGIAYANGGTQVSYDKEPGVIESQVGDKVRLCLVSLPQDCPPGDDRGKIYETTNLRTGATWQMPDSEHMCGGA